MTVTFARRVGLRPLLPSDMDAIDTLDMEMDAALDWRYHGAVPPPPARALRRWQGALDQQVFFRPVDGSLLGYGALYDHDPRSETAWLAVVARPDIRRSGWALAAAGLYVTVSFLEWPLRTIYAETRGDNFGQFSSAVDGQALTIAGRFRDARLRPDRTTEDLWWLAIRREGWMDLYGPRFLKAILADPPPSLRTTLSVSDL